MEIKKVGIVGMGALGVMYGKHLTDKLGKENVFFIADEERVKRYRESEVFCNGEACDFSFRSPKEAVTADLLIFAVKFMGMEAAISEAHPFVGGDTLIFSVLNGVSSEGMLEEAFGPSHVLYACVQGMDAGKEGNCAHYGRMGYIAIGNRDGSRDERLLSVTDFLDFVGLAYQVPEDIVKAQWGKLMLNTGVNQVTAVYQAPYRLVQHEGEARTMMIEAMKEVKRVAECKDVELTDEDIRYWLDILDSLSPDGRTSMCQDVLAGRKTEAELFSGTMIRMAKEEGIRVPVNEFLYERIRDLEEAAGVTE